MLGPPGRCTSPASYRQLSAGLSPVQRTDSISICRENQTPAPALPSLSSGSLLALLESADTCRLSSIKGPAHLADGGQNASRNGAVRRQTRAGRGAAASGGLPGQGAKAVRRAAEKWRRCGHLFLAAEDSVLQRFEAVDILALAGLLRRLRHLRPLQSLRLLLHVQARPLSGISHGGERRKEDVL